MPETTPKKPEPPKVEELAAEVVALAQSRLMADLRFLSPSLEQLRPRCPG